MKPILWRGLSAVILALILGAAPTCAQSVITTAAGSTFVFRGAEGTVADAPPGLCRGVAVDSSENVLTDSPLGESPSARDLTRRATR